MVKKVNHGSLRSSDGTVEPSEYVYVTFPDAVCWSTSDDMSIEAEKYLFPGAGLMGIVWPSQTTLSGGEPAR